MASYNSALKTWGANGSEYPDGYNYTAGDQPVDAWDNFLTSNLIGDISHLINVTNDRIESDSGGSGGEPASPEASHLYHDQNAERLNVWDASSSVWRNHLRRGGDTMAGVLDMGGYQIEDSTGTLTLAGNVNVSSTLSQVGLTLQPRVGSTPTLTFPMPTTQIRLVTPTRLMETTQVTSRR